MKKLNKEQAIVSWASLITALLIILTRITVFGIAISLILIGVGLGIAIGKILD